MKLMILFKKALIIISIFFVSAAAFATEGPQLSNGQLVYVPAYSHIYIGNRESPFLLTVTLSIRNINLKHDIEVTRVEYYESQGKLLRKLVSKPVTIKPLGTIRFVIPENDSSGGSGANFIVQWRSTQKVNPAIIESIMIGTKSQQGVSFTSRGKEIFEVE